ncbi:hypothetical protein D3C85_1466290 [compost metagenome]
MPSNTHEFGKELSIDFTIDLPNDIENLAFSFQLIDEFQNLILHSWQIDSEFSISREKGKYKFSCFFDKMRLYIGTYSLRVYLSNSRSKIRYDYIDSTCNFKVEMIRNQRDDYKWEAGACKYIEDSKWIIEKS